MKWPLTMSSDSESIELFEDKEFGVTTEYRFVMVPHWLLEMTVDEEPLPSSAIHLYNCLMYFANKQRDCYPSYDTLKKMTGMSRGTVAKYLQLLMDNGALTWTRRTYKGYNTSNLYHLPELPIENVIGKKLVVTEEKGFDVSEVKDTGFDVGDEVKKKVAKDPFWGVMADCFGFFPKEKKLKQQWAVAISDIRQYTVNADDIRLAYDRYPQFMPKGATITVSALAKHFPQLIATQTDTVVGTIDKLESLKTRDS